MKKFVAATIALALMGVALPAFAQSQQQDDTPTEFIHIEDMFLNGDPLDPQVQVVTVPKSPDFERLQNLKRSFLPKIQHSTADNALD